MSKKDRAKLISLILFIAGITALLLTGDGAITTVQGFSGGPPPGHTGAPGDLTCLECHTGSPLQNPNLFSITAPSSYEPGKTYQISVKHTNSDRSRMQWGFQLTALAGGSRAGTLQPINNLT